MPAALSLARMTRRHVPSLLASRQDAQEQAREHLARAVAEETACKARLDAATASLHAALEAALADEAGDDAVASYARGEGPRQAEVCARREAWQRAVDATQHARCVLAAMLKGAEPL